MNIPRFLLCALSILIGFQRADATARGTVSMEKRELQSFESTALEATVVFGFDFNGRTPEITPTSLDIEELLRLTEIFYRRNLASAYPNTYQNIELAYKSHTWEATRNILKVDFDVSATFRVSSAPFPSDEEVWNIIGNIDSATYINHAASLALPMDLFLWTNSAKVAPRIISPFATAAPTSAFSARIPEDLLQITAFYGFVFDGPTPEVAPNATDMDSLLHLTEIYYRHTLATVFESKYQSIAVTYQSHSWHPDMNVLILDFDLTADFHNVSGNFSGHIPNRTEVWNVVQNIDSRTYVNHAAKLATPQELFFWTNTTNFAHRVNTSGTPAPTYPTAYTLYEEVPTEVPTFAPKPPKPARAPAPKPVPVTGNAPSPVSVSIPNPVSLLDDDATVLDQFHSFGGTSSDSSDSSYSSESEEEPTEEHVGVKTTSEVSQPKGGQHDTPGISDSQEGSEPKSKDAFELKTDLATKETQGDGVKEGCNAWAYKYLTDILTAPNMLYWMAAVRVLYYAMSIMLHKWGCSYRVSNKKLHVQGYWVQFSVCLPLLAVLIWSLLSIQDNDRSVKETGLSYIAQAFMLLLGLHGMDIFLRDSMDRALLVQRLLFVATLLYVIEFKDAGLHNPIDQITFGAFEAVGACSELAAQWNLIYYRSWADATPLEQERMRSGVSSTLLITLVCGFLAKIAFLTSCIVWYVLRLDALDGSYLLYLVPLVRVVQAPFLIQSFHVQCQLYNKVKAAPPAMVTKQDLEENDTNTDDGSQSNSGSLEIESVSELASEPESNISSVDDVYTDDGSRSNIGSLDNV